MFEELSSQSAVRYCIGLKIDLRDYGQQAAQERESRVRKECWGSQEQSVVNLGTALGCC